MFKNVNKKRYIVCDVVDIIRYDSMMNERGIKHSFITDRVNNVVYINYKSKEPIDLLNETDVQGIGWFK